MLYITGDMHGNYSSFAERRLDRLKKDDTLIITGDFGFIWDNSKEEIKSLKKIEKKKYRVLFIEGAHENFEKLREYPEEEIYGAAAYKIADNIYCLKRGEIYTIEGTSVFALGGGLPPHEAEADDPIKLPNDDELQHAVDNLQARRRRVDIIITHEAPASVKRLIDRNAAVNDLNIFLDTMLHNTRYGKWFFGSLHEDRAVSGNLICVYEKVIPANSK